MSRPELSLVLPHEQQIPHKHRKIEEHPAIAIVRQTSLLLELLGQGAIRDHRPAKNYLKGETMDYIETAEKGSTAVFHWPGVLFRDSDPTMGDAASHAMLAFRLMSQSQRLIQDRAFELTHPRTEDEFRERLDELKIGVMQAADGKLTPDVPWIEIPALFRTFEFFRVASQLPLAA